MIDDVIPYLACPLCGRGFELRAGSLTCSSGHSFDVSRYGYVNVLPGDAHTGTADTADMVRAREAFLATGAFSPIAEAIARASREAAPPGEGCVVDAGAGTGYYLASVLAARPGRAGLALDISKHAARRSARLGRGVGALVCDTWGTLPVATGAAALVLDIFAPRNASEFRRVLRADGALIVVTPTIRHLAELVAALGLLEVDPDKDSRLRDALEGLFEEVGVEPIEARMHLSRAEVGLLVRSGPSARHRAGDLAERLEALPEPVAVTLSVEVAMHRPL